MSAPTATEIADTLKAAHLSRRKKQSELVVLTKTFGTFATGANQTETDLWSYSLPAGMLHEDGQALRIRVYGTFAANANTKTVRFYFGSQVTGLNSVTTAPNNANLLAEVFVARKGAATQDMVRTAFVNTAVQGISITAPTEALGSAVTIRVTGQNGTANAGDITIRGVVVELLN